LRNQRGEGLISVLISVAILGLLVMTLVSLYEIYGVMMNKSLLRREADNLIYRIRAQVSRRYLCQISLAGNTWDKLADPADQPADTDIVVRDSSGVIAQTGMLLANGQLTMDRVYIRRFQIDANGGQYPGQCRSICARKDRRNELSGSSWRNRGAFPYDRSADSHSRYF
jgi:Tfp pilus assembly protein PilE